MIITVTRQCIVVLFVLLIVALSAEDFHKTLFRVTKDLEGGLDLTLHCKSSDDDLGIHLLHFHTYFQFRFWPNFSGTTKFRCSMQWEGEKVQLFDIYKYRRDDVDKCKDDTCLWIIKSSGPCMYSLHGKYDLCYPWN